MLAKQQLAELETWPKHLGLLPVPLFHDQTNENSFVLLNGRRGSFCLDFQRTRLNGETRNFAWSSNVGHYVALGNSHVEVQRWDQQQAIVERYSLSSVANNLEQFHEYLERNTPQQELSVVSHAMRVFRSLRSVIGLDTNGSWSLRAFLYLLGCVTDNVERGELNLAKWRLSHEAAVIANTVRSDDWRALREELVRGRPFENLYPQFSLLLRHASGQLFQEAHYEAVYVPQKQLRFEGILPRPIELSGTARLTGVHYTPPSLVRTIVEEALSELEFQPSITIFDPACGSGEFLREALRQLKLRRYLGEIHLIGWDISEAACDMANFALAWEAQNIQARITIQTVDSLSVLERWPQNVDLVLTNPPFVSWQDMNAQQKEALDEILKGGVSYRPDLSFAFLWQAVSSLRKGGVMGSIIPASLLDSDSAATLRQRLRDELSIRLVARLGSHLLFSSATIDTGLLVAEKDEATSEPTVALWSDHRTDSTFASLRALRKIRYLGKSRIYPTYPVVNNGFSIYLLPDLENNIRSWAPRSYRSWKLLQSLKHFPKVKDLFNVRQGSRTGHNRVFLLDKNQWLDLRNEEKRFFRPAIVNKSVVFGYIRDTTYAFFPYGENSVSSENELREKLPQYYSNYLLPAKGTLSSRNSLRGRDWWEFSEPRSWQVNREPKLVSTYFGDAGSFGWDQSGDYVVVQGFAWLPKSSTGYEVLPAKVGYAYLVILNSQLFSLLLSASSNHVGGGQWNLSSKFVSEIAIPNLLSVDIAPSLLAEAAEIGKQIHEADIPHTKWSV